MTDVSSKKEREDSATFTVRRDDGHAARSRLKNFQHMQDERVVTFGLWRKSASQASELIGVRSVVRETLGLAGLCWSFSTVAVYVESRADGPDWGMTSVSVEATPRDSDLPKLPLRHDLELYGWVEDLPELGDYLRRLSQGVHS